MKKSEFINHVLPVIKSQHGTGTISYLDLEEGGKIISGFNQHPLRNFKRFGVFPRDKWRITFYGGSGKRSCDSKRQENIRKI